MSDASYRELERDAVRATFPGWHIGGSCRNWYAFRGGTVASSGPWSLLRRNLHADTLLALAEKLCLQEYLDGLNDQQLAEVWQRVGLPESPGQAAS